MSQQADAARHHPPPDVSVVIVNWNAAEYLQAALDSLYSAQGDLELEVFFIDNASNDGSVSLVRSCYPDAHIIANAENRGFAAANNQGITRARGRYILLLNPDTELPADALILLMGFMDDHPGVGAVGPRLQGKGGKIQGGSAGYDPSPATIFNFATFLYRLLPRHFRGLWLPRSLYSRSGPIVVDWISGACMMLRRSVVAETGGMNERFFMYSEDVEWCRRIRMQGYQIVCLPHVHVTHHVGGSSRQLGPAFYAHNIDSLDLDLRGRYGGGPVACMHMIGAFGFLLRYLLYELYLLRWRNPIFADLRDLWAACLKTSLQRARHPASPAMNPSSMGD